MDKEYYQDKVNQAELTLKLLNEAVRNRMPTIFRRRMEDCCDDSILDIDSISREIDSYKAVIADAEFTLKYMQDELKKKEEAADEGKN